jgi:hypothetical protein
MSYPVRHYTPLVVGDRRGRLVVEGISFDAESRKTMVSCRCDCGCEMEFVATDVNAGKRRSCGCSRRPSGGHNKTHGLTKTPLHRIWTGMRERCYCQTSSHYPDYGARGIRICERWSGTNGFTNFLADMGPRPPKHQIERIDNNGNYEPSNCRWATVSEQARNRRSNVLVTFSGTTKTLREWCDQLEVKYALVWDRLTMGWPPERAFSQPSRRAKGNK